MHTVGFRHNWYPSLLLPPSLKAMTSYFNENISNKNLASQPIVGSTFMVNQRTMDEILGSLTPRQKETTQNLRTLIKEAVPETVEVIKRGRITYKLEGKDFVWISNFSDHVDLEFAMGASLGSSLLRSRGIAETNDNVRHVPINDFVRVKPELARLIAEAAKLEFEHCPTR